MRVLVTGQHGQVARSLIDAAPALGIAIVAAGRPALDLCDASSVAGEIARQRPAVVINAAAYTQVDKAESAEAEAFAVNADGAGHVARACAQHGIPLIHLSTDFVFDGRKATPYAETDATAPLNAYGRSKLAGEQRVAALCPQHLILRTSWVHSPYGSNFVRTMLRLAGDRPAISVVDDQHGNPTYAPHLADAVLVLAQRIARDPARMRWGVYHAAGRGETTWCGLAREVFNRAAVHGLPSAAVIPIASAAYPTPAQRPQNSRLDCNALQSAFGITLPDWRAGVAHCVARIAQAQGGASPQQQANRG